jgi:hypothetical protein
MTYFFWTYLVRGLGLLLVLPSLFPSMFINWFPGLEDRRIAWILFAVGVAVYIGASVVFQICKKRERTKKDAWEEDLK